jgi:hypothetical protein
MTQKERPGGGDARPLGDATSKLAASLALQSTEAQARPIPSRWIPSGACADMPDFPPTLHRLSWKSP